MGGGGNGSPVSQAGAGYGQQSLTNGKYSPPSEGAQYNASYQPTQAQQFQIPSLDQMGQQLNQFQQPGNLAGLQAAFAQMMAGNMGMQQPMQRGLINPDYQSQALKYKPNLAAATQNLNKVVPSVAEQQRLQAIEDARIKAEADDDAAFANWQRQQYEASKNQNYSSS